MQVGLHQKRATEKIVGVRAESAAGADDCAVDSIDFESQDSMQGFK